MKSEIFNIPFTDIEQIPQLIKDYINGKLEDSQQFLFQKENIDRILLQKKDFFDTEKRKILCDVLQDQMPIDKISELQKQNLDLLQQENTFTVCTGHQLNLYTGPVFFVYKILQTIKTAEKLKKYYPNHNFVPVFWMASEDHDFEEINHFITQHHYYEMTNSHLGGAVGRMKVERTDFIAEFEEEFKDSTFGYSLIKMMKDAYQKGKTLSEAIRDLVQYLFSDYGLLVIDADESRLKSQMETIFKEELLQNALYHSVQHKVDYLKEKYGKVQVNPREINLFYLTDTRNRIVFQNGEFIVLETNISFTKEEIIDELKAHPERFSPNALMRPIYQECILPNIAYVGGNAEIMYWLELTDYFEHLSLPCPMLIPRNSMLFLSEKQTKKMKKLNLEKKDLFFNFSDKIQEVLMRGNQIEPLLHETKERLEKQFDDLKGAAQQTDNSFLQMVEAEQVRQLKSFKRLKKRLLKAEKIKQNEKVERIENLYLDIHPGAKWQERVYNFSVFYADHGLEWFESCNQTIFTETPQMIVVSVFN